MLTSDFEHHLMLQALLPEKHALHGRVPSALAEANVAAGDIAIPIVDALECAFNTSAYMEPRSLAEAVGQPDADLWVVAALAEIEAHCDDYRIFPLFSITFPSVSNTPSRRYGRPNTFRCLRFGTRHAPLTRAHALFHL